MSVASRSTLSIAVRIAGVHGSAPKIPILSDEARSALPLHFLGDHL